MIPPLVRRGRAGLMLFVLFVLDLLLGVGRAAAGCDRRGVLDQHRLYFAAGVRVSQVPQRLHHHARLSDGAAVHGERPTFPRVPAP